MQLPLFDLQLRIHGSIRHTKIVIYFSIKIIAVSSIHEYVTELRYLS